jgi:hypothetical protein
MEQTAGDEGLSVEAVSGVMAIDVASLANTGIGTTMAVGQTGVELFGEKILASYERTLDELNSQGAGAYLNRYMKPFMDAAVEHFDPNKSTWTQDALLGRPVVTKPNVQESATEEEMVDKSTNGEPVDDDIPGDESAVEVPADEASTG